MDDKTREWQMEMVMEKLRSKSPKGKSFFDLAKSHRMALLEKRYPLDSVEKNLLQKCLDILQHSVKVNTLQAMIERLESISRQLGLKFMAGQTNFDWFISSDMFYLEVVLEGNGGVRDVKIHHEGKVEQQSCAELVDCLSKRDFADFTTQLEGLVSIYQVNAEKKIKCKAFSALQSLETDLATLASLQTFIKEPFNLVHKSPVGALEKRKGGHPMKLTYFVSPYDLLDVENKTCRSLRTDALGSTGLSATVTMESSSAHKLQISTLISINKNLTGKSTPVYAPLTVMNSNSLPAVFVLKLSEPLPMCISLVKKIMEVTDIEVADLSSPQPLVSLITQHSSAGQLNCGVNRGLFVTLPEQQHCYFVTENRNLDGVVVSSIPFTHPAHVAQILNYLRQQALFNTLIMSCIRPNSKQDVEKTIIFELMPWSWQHITVSFIHPYDENMTTAELDLTDIANLKCSVNSTLGDGHAAIIASEYPSKVLQRSFSIPITMRALLKCWEMETRLVNGMDISGLGGSNSGNIGGNPNNNNKNQQPPINEFDPDVKIKLEPNLDYPSLNGSHNSDFNNPGFQSFSTSPITPRHNLAETNNPDLVTISKNLDSGTKKFRKRKSADSLPKKSPKSKDESEAKLGNTDDATVSDTTPKSTNPVLKASCSSTPEIAPSGGNVDSSKSIGEKPGDFQTDSFMEATEAEDDGVEEFLKSGAKKNKKSMVEITTIRPNDKKSPTQHVTEFSNKNLVSPSLSISPVSVKPNMSALPSMVLERRPGIEIFPVVSSPIPQSPVSSSITITAISAKTVSDEKLREKKKLKSELDKSKLEKKRKRKRDDSPMGPPDKVPSKQDSKAVLSVKPSESASPQPSSPAGTVRKYNCSPTHTSLSGKSSPASNCSSKSSKPILVSHTSKSTSPSTSSPKSSPISASASPKHSLLVSKQVGSSGSGKPSMSTLKSAVSSPSSTAKSDPKKSSSKDSRDKDRKSSNFSSSGRSSPKIKSASVKLKALPVDLPVDSTILVTDGSLASCLDPKQAVMRNRKGSLSAVIDKLKSAQGGTGDPGGEGNDGGGGGGSNKSTTPTKDSRSSSSYSGKVSDKLTGNKVDSGKNPGEYMVKPSLDGMKITINKKKDSKSGGKTVASSGTNSPKGHTGLKPGVQSGPASKKPQVITKTNSSSSISSKSPSSKPFQRSNSSGNLTKSVKSTNSSKPGSDVNRNKAKFASKLDPGKSIFSSKTGKASPTMIKDDSESKSSKIDSGHPAQILESFKLLDTKFQIPKLSARVNNTSADSEGSKKSAGVSDKSYHNSSESTRSDTKVNEVGSKPDHSVSKHPVVSLNLVKNVDENTSNNDSSKKSSSSKIPDTPDTEAPPLENVSSSSVSSSEVSQSTVSTSVSLPKSKSDTNLKLSSLTSNLSASKDDSLSSLKMDLPISNLSFKDNGNSSFKKVVDSSTSKTSETSSKANEAPKGGAGAQSQEVAEILMDFSSSSFPNNNKTLDTQKLAPAPERMVSSFQTARRNNSPSVFPHSPSVQIHIVKSPASILPSPHSASPCITDDELMDEALVGIGK